MGMIASPFIFASTLFILRGRELILFDAPRDLSCRLHAYVRVGAGRCGSSAGRGRNLWSRTHRQSANIGETEMTFRGSANHALTGVGGRERGEGTKYSCVITHNALRERRDTTKKVAILLAPPRPRDSSWFSSRPKYAVFLFVSS